MYINTIFMATPQHLNISRQWSSAAYSLPHLLKQVNQSLLTTGNLPPIRFSVREDQRNTNDRCMLYQHARRNGPSFLSTFTFKLKCLKHVFHKKHGTRLFRWKVTVNLQNVLTMKDSTSTYFKIPTFAIFYTFAFNGF